MEAFISRYRNLTVLVLLVLGQLLLLAWEVKGNNDARLIRVWAVTAIAPLARGTEWLRGTVGGFWSNYFISRNVHEENRRLKQELGKIRLENTFLKNQLSVAERAQALESFRSSIPSKTLPAMVIGTGTGSNSRVVYVDRGTREGVKRGMAVITPEGIAGKVVAAYPTASLVMLVTEQGFAAGVISQKNRVRGTLKGRGASTCLVDYIQNEDKLEPGEWFYTTGDDRIFPRGLPVGRVSMVREGRGGKEVFVVPSALAQNLDVLLILLDGVHGDIPEPGAPSEGDVSILPPPPQDLSTSAGPESQPGALLTDADRLREKYRRIGESQGHTFGVSPGRAPDFNKEPPPGPVSVPQKEETPGAAPGNGAQQPAPAPAAKPPARQ
jgi:rod shape-determining protein MreC